LAPIETMNAVTSNRDFITISPGGSEEQDPPYSVHVRAP
jgi:hypothetical protein